ncbi:MAG: efflux RND transporter periplasmic adaptor subunit [Myxococcales bacterium]|nr:efflux RND transporter periplasmic adaptor subunit [Myxococcales bacterium]MCB9646003.1 efflux RND transporter periplasmic adaptor subunit [Deltaproteobacteria bacterium]
MKRIAGIFIVLIVVFSVGIALKVRENRAALSGPSGGSGIIEGTEADVVARIPARITKVLVDEGDAVEAGQVLVELDCREQQAVLRAAQAREEAGKSQAKAAEAQMRAALGASEAAQAQVGAAGAQREALETGHGVATRQLTRLEKLEGEGGATEMELDRVSGQARQLSEQIRALDAQVKAAKGQAMAAKGQAEAARAQAEAAVVAVTAAEADVARAESLVEECTLRSPLTGYVEVRAYEPQEVVLPGTRVLTVVRLSPAKTSFYIPNAELAEAKVGRKVTFTADAWPGKTFEGAITQVAKDAEFTPRNVQTREDRDRLVYRVEVRAENAEGLLRPGMPVEVTIPGSERE